MEPVVRVGATVRRIAGPWTESVHKLLRRYQLAGIAGVPQALGTDEDGREILSFVPGEVMSGLDPTLLWSRTLLSAAARLLRQIHDASEPLTSMELTWRQQSHRPVEVICHNDFAPYNLIVRRAELAGVIDFDMASPGSRLWDLAYLAYRIVPYAEDATSFDPARDGSRGHRLAELMLAYGRSYPVETVQQAAAGRLDVLAEFTQNRAALTGRADLAEHAAMYRRDARRLRRG